MSFRERTSDLGPIKVIECFRHPLLEDGPWVAYMQIEGAMKSDEPVTRALEEYLQRIADRTPGRPMVMRHFRKDIEDGLISGNVANIRLIFPTRITTGRTAHKDLDLFAAAASRELTGLDPVDKDRFKREHSVASAMAVSSTGTMLAAH